MLFYMLIADRHRPRPSLQGPFTMYRNTPEINALYTRAVAWKETIDSDEVNFFDEWGGFAAPQQKTDRSMSFTLSRLAAEDPPTVRVYSKRHPIAWDYVGFGRAELFLDPIPKSQVFKCTLSVRDFASGTSQSNHLVAQFHPDALSIWPAVPTGDMAVAEVFMCHYQFGKVPMRDQLSK